MKGTNIAFYKFYLYGFLLDVYNIHDYKGFIYIYQLIFIYSLSDINSELINQIRYMGKYAKIDTYKARLLEVGV
jgi:hypothetical protein